MLRTTPQAIPVAPEPGVGLLEHDHVRAGAAAALAELDGEVVGGREAVHAGADDDETGRSGYHVELPPGQRHVKNEQMEGTTARTGQPAVRHVAAVERAFAVLDALADGQELGTNEIARRTGINASTVSRLLATLAAARFVEHVPEIGRYRLSLRLVELGNAVLGRLDLRVLARPHLQALVQETGETATLSAPGEHDAVTVDFAHSSSVVQSVAQLGRPSVGHATAAGKVMLAFGDVELPHRAAAVRSRRARSRPGRSSSRSSSAFAGAATPRPGRSARRASQPWPRPCSTAAATSSGIVGVQGPAARFDARAMRRAVPLVLGARRGASRPRSAPRSAQAGLGRQPDEAGRPLADPLRQLGVRAPLETLAIRADDEEARCALGDELEQRLDRPGAAEPQPLDLDGE